MTSLLKVRKAADELTGKSQAGLVAQLLPALPSAPSGPDDDEADRREMEMDAGSVATLSHDEFLLAVGRG